MVQEEAPFPKVFNFPVCGSHAVDFNTVMTAYILFHSVSIFNLGPNTRSI